MTFLRVNLSDIELSAYAPTFDREAARSWIELIHGTSPGLIHICSTGNWTGRTFSEKVDAVDYIERLNAQGREGIYMRTTTLARPLRDEHTRGSAADSLCLPGFAGDIDIAGPGHKHAVCTEGCDKNHQHKLLDLPPDMPTAASIITEAGLPEPTVWVHSGGGLYPWWIFDTPITLGEHYTVDEVQHVSRQLQQVIKAAAERLGWAYGAEVWDVARVLRVPGTVNRKDGLARPCRVVAETYNFTTYEELRAQVEQLHAQAQAQAQAQATVVQAPKPMPAPQRTDTGGLSPGDDFEARTTWDDQSLLGGAGWTLLYARGNTYHWKRPGKTTPGISATTGRDAGRDRLYVFSAEADPFPVNEPITKFHAYALLHHAGDHSAAATELRRLGFGEQRPYAPPASGLYDLIPPRNGGGAGSEKVVPVESAEQAEPADTPGVKVVSHEYFLSDIGNAARLRDTYSKSFRFHAGKRVWYTWDKDRWAVDETGAVERAARDTTFQMVAEARQLRKVDEKAGNRLFRHAEASQSNARILGMVKRFASEEGVTATSDTFDGRSELITMDNGTFNLDTFTLQPHSPEDMLTRRFRSTYDPAAQCPQFEAFLERLLPDPATREYIQRAMGYTLMGKVDKRSIFLLYGPPGTGKSQFLNIMRAMFGDFGGTAAAATLRASKSTQTNDLHGLRGKRFVATSETSDSVVLDEELIKRLTGHDAITSRELYEKNQEWQPECTIWMATNPKPKLSPDDPAIWTRVKPILFDTQFSAEPGAANKEIPNLGEKIFKAEAAGIFNWLLAGARMYMESGLPEPQAVKESMAEHKLESDTVAQFIVDGTAEGIIAVNEESRIKASQLLEMYERWCMRNHFKPVGARKFGQRMSGLGYCRERDVTWYWIGFTVGSAGMFGTL